MCNVTDKIPNKNHPGKREPGSRGKKRKGQPVKEEIVNQEARKEVGKKELQEIIPAIVSGVKHPLNNSWPSWYKNPDKRVC